MKISIYFLALLTIFFCSNQDSLAEVRLSSDDYLSAFEQYLDDTVVDEVPGAALVVVNDGKISLIKTYGVREKGVLDPITEGTVFRLASVSKTIASSAAALLVQDKQLMWETKVSSQLNHIQFKNSRYGKQITLRDLMSHSSGLVPHAYTNLVQDGVPYRKIISRLDNVDFVCPPGKCYGYQNVAFSLIGDIIEANTGKQYEHFVTENLFKPLGMKRASFGLDSFVTDDNHALPHVKINKQWKPVDVSNNYYNIAPAAGANASIKDMAQWLLAHLGHRQDVLTETTLSVLHTRIIKTTKSQAHYGQRDAIGGAYYGLGWRIFDFGQHKDFIHHGGWVQGMRSEIVFNKKLQIGLVFLSNAESRYAGDVVFEFLKLYDKYNQDTE